MSDAIDDLATLHLCEHTTGRDAIEAALLRYQQSRDECVVTYLASACADLIVLHMLVNNDPALADAFNTLTDKLTTDPVLDALVERMNAINEAAETEHVN